MEVRKIIDIGIKPVEKKKILIVDDEPSLHSLISDTFSNEHRIISSFNGREGVQSALNIIPDMILMDVMMPDMGGYEAVKLLNSQELTRKIPVVMITARNFDESTVQMLKNEPNVVAFISKPFRPKELRELVKAVLKIQ